jgi:hypothetical protein
LWHSCWSIVFDYWNSNSKFEFYLFEPFQISKILSPSLPYLAQQPNSSSSWLWPNSEWQPSNLRAPAQLAQQPPSPSVAAAQLAFRPNSAASPPQLLPASASVTESWGPAVIPFVEPHPTGTPPPLPSLTLARPPVRGPHAKTGFPGLFKAALPPGSSSPVP